MKTISFITLIIFAFGEGVNAQNHIGKWILTEGTYNGNAIQNLNAEFIFENDEHYEASFEQDSNTGWCNGYYSITGTVLHTNVGASRELFPNGFSWGWEEQGPVNCDGHYSPKIYNTRIFSSDTALIQFGEVALGFSADKQAETNPVGYLQISSVRL